jgi:hypothetical protein
MRRTLGSRKRRAETRALHKAMSGPLLHTSSDITSTDREDEADDMDEEDVFNDQDPEVLPLDSP